MLASFFLGRALEKRIGDGGRGRNRVDGPDVTIVIAAVRGIGVGTYLDYVLLCCWGSVDAERVHCRLSSVRPEIYIYLS
jgi:hypothetical protein